MDIGCFVQNEQSGVCAQMTPRISPRCVADFVVSPTDAPPTELGSFDGQNYFLSLSCRCSGRSFLVRSIFAPHFYLKHATATGSITLHCVTCGRESICFDPSHHGLDAELDHFPSSSGHDGQLGEFACPRCAETSFEIITRFEYPATALLGRPSEPSGAAEEDLFTYFMLIGTCHSCGLISVAADVQCA
jgi:hypothetical protein